MSEPFRKHRCRHERNKGFTKTCAIGLDPQQVTVRLTQAQRDAFGGWLPIGSPCVLGCRHGLTCPGFAPHTAEELEADEQQTRSMLAAIAADRCICGSPLVHQGSHFRCSISCANPLSGHACRDLDRR